MTLAFNESLRIPFKPSSYAACQIPANFTSAISSVRSVCQRRARRNSDDHLKRDPPAVAAVRPHDECKLCLAGANQVVER